MEDPATITESSLLSKLESPSDLSSIHRDFSVYLQPFSDIINKPNKQSKSTKTKGETSNDIRSLAKEFGSFFSHALHLIPKRLKENPEIDDRYASELFESYTLCIRCLESILSVLTCQPHEVKNQRLRLIICYEKLGRYDDASKEGFLVLEIIGSNESHIPEVAQLFLETAVTLYQCVSNGQSKNQEDYERLLPVVDKMQPWFGVLDKDAYKNMQGKLVEYLKKCSLFMVGEPSSFDRSLTHRFCELTIRELAKISINDQMEKFVHEICFSQKYDHPLCSVDILTRVLDAMALKHKTDVNREDGSDSVRLQLAVSYCLRALHSQEAEPNSKDFIQDIGEALKLWTTQEHFQSSEQAQNTLTLLYRVIDFLSLKGYTEHHSNIYKTMIKIFTQKNRPLQECLNILWKSRNVTHALCPSPVHDSFIMTFSNHRDSSKSMENWISCMKGSEVGFRQSFSLISTLSSPDSCKHNHATQLHSTIDEVKQTASNLITSGSISRKSAFHAANLYHDLSERMIAQGLMIEALNNAKEASRLRTALFHDTFTYKTEPQNNTYILKTFHMHPSVASSTWLKDNKGDCVMTPWKILQVYLESTLQEGILQDLVGNDTEAKSLLYWGQRIASFQELPIFIVGFSCALAKIYRKQQLWDLAKV